MADTATVLAEEPHRQVWVKDASTCWVKAVVQSTDGDVLTLLLDGEELREVSADAVYEVDPSHEVDLPDITAMNNLHEAPLLHLLRDADVEHAEELWIATHGAPPAIQERNAAYLRGLGFAAASAAAAEAARGASARGRTPKDVGASASG